MYPPYVVGCVRVIRRPSVLHTTLSLLCSLPITRCTGKGAGFNRVQLFCKCILFLVGIVRMPLPCMW